MALSINPPISVADFDDFIHQSDHTDRLYEFIRGEIWEVVSNNYCSQIASIISFQIQLHMKQHHIKGYVTGADGGYQIGNERYMPDVGFISYTRQSEPCREAYNPLPPDLAVEVISPTDDDRKLRVKIVNYLAVNVVVWVVNPEDETVEIYQSGQPVTVINIDGIITGGDVLPNFKLPVRDVFPPLYDDES